MTDEDGAAVPDAVISAPAPGALRPESVSQQPPEVFMTQLDKRFVPHVLPVIVGSIVHFTNRDPINHYVYSFSAPKQFSLKLRKGESVAPAIQFNQAGVVVLGCNIHDWMLGYIVVLDTPYFAVTDATGEARLEWQGSLLPALRLWHPRIDGSPLTLTPRSEAGVVTVRVPRLSPDPRPEASY